MEASFWKDRRVLLTGHTGFKGSWLSLWLHRMGAKVQGYALSPPTDPSLFEAARIGPLLSHQIADVRDLQTLKATAASFEPQVVFHMAAQSLVRESYTDPVGTYSTNVMGTVHLLEACRGLPSLQAVVIITTDKCYENREWPFGYREIDPMGGSDPYSNSKGCAELVTQAYARSFFEKAQIPVASVRAGNVIGGGDWAKDRLIPDCARAFLADETLMIRNPKATRPWQHVLEPLHGYLSLAERLCANGARYSGGWNFGPAAQGNLTVGAVVDQMTQLWGGAARWAQDPSEQPKEAQSLHLDISKARVELSWTPALSLARTLEWTVRWYQQQAKGQDARALCAQDIDEYEAIRDERAEH